MKEPAKSNTEVLKKHWNRRSVSFAKKYLQPSIIDLLLWKGIYRCQEIVSKELQCCEQSATLLDIGCGPGINMVNWLKKFEHLRAEGIDIAEQMILVAQEYAQKNHVAHRVELYVGNFLDLDIPGKKFDVIVAAGVTDYIANMNGFLNKCKQLNAGSIVLTWPGKTIRSKLRMFWYPYPVFDYSKQDIKMLSRNCGLSCDFAFEGRGGYITIHKNQQST